MRITVFAKRRTTKEGKKFFAYLTTLTRKDGSTVNASVRFQSPPSPEDCPLNIDIDRVNANLATKCATSAKTGESTKYYTLWVKNWQPSAEVWRDKSLDDFDD